MLLKRAEILAADDLKKEVVSVPEWGGDVMVRALPSDAVIDLMVEYSARTKDGKTWKEFTSYFLSKTICDESGAAIFDDDEGRQALGQKSQAAIAKLFKAANALNPMTDKDVADAEKNSEGALDASSSDSRSDSDVASESSLPE